jgi:hypothetical protein
MSAEDDTPSVDLDRAAKYDNHRATLATSSVDVRPEMPCPVNVLTTLLKGEAENVTWFHDDCDELSERS